MANLGASSTNFAMPQHPLPEEIRRMERDETVCKFCGVSYLIHNEVKALEERLAEAERQMEHYKGSVEREKVLKEKLESMDENLLKQTEMLKEQSQQLELFKSDLKMKADLINKMYSQKRQTERDLEEMQNRSEKSRNQLSQLSALLPSLYRQVRQQKECVNTLKKEAAEQQLSYMKNVIECVRKDWEQVLRQVVKKIESERKSAEIRLEDINGQLKRSKTELNELRLMGSQVTELQSKSGTLEGKLAIYEKHMKFVEEENKTLREKTSAIENELHLKSSEGRKARTDLESLQREREREHLKEIENISQKDEEIKKLNTLCKSLEKLMNKKSALEMEARRRTTDKEIELETLEKSLTKARQESGKLRLQREQTLVAHHSRIEELRQSYAKKLADSETSCRQLQEEIREQRTKLVKDLEDCKMMLTEKFEKEQEKMKSEHVEEVRLLQTENNDLNHKLEEETRIRRNLKEEIHQTKNALSTTKANNAQEVQRYQNEVLDLKARLDDVQQRAEGRDERESFGEIEGIKRKYHNAQKLFQDAQKQVKALEIQLTTKENEMLVLQDTVHRECEERLELTQALSDARMQLLSFQQNSGVSRKTATANRDQPIENGTARLIDRPRVVAKISGTKATTASDVRRIKSTGSDSPRATRENVDSFRERIALALGRQSRVNHTR